MIRATHARNSRGVLSAYRDNAAVIEGGMATRFFPDPLTHRYAGAREPAHILMKVETHNHPTAISPFPGAATGAGGEIRDEGATGIGAKTQGRTHRLLGVESQDSRHAAALGARLRQAAENCVGARDHDRRAARRRGLQQRIRAPQHLRILPHVRASERRIRPHRGARLSQTHHDRRGTRQCASRGCGEKRGRDRRTADRARRTVDVDRFGRRCGFIRRQRAEFLRS